MLRIAIALVAVGLGIVGCAGGQGQDSRPNGGSEAGLTGSELVGEWRLGSIRAEPIDAGATGRAPTMRIDPDGSIGGFAGVNSWGATLDTELVGEGRFETTPAHSTLMAGPPEAMRVESRYLSALREVERFDLTEDGGLVLLGRGGEELLRFVRAG